MAYKTLIFEKQEDIAIIKLNRPERMNAVSEKMYSELQSLLNTIENDNEIRAIILTGTILNKNNNIKQTFCAGADLKDHSAGKRTHLDKRIYIEIAHDVTKYIYEFPKPIIALVNGPARGAGAEIAFSCDFIIMAENATIAFPEIGLGTFVGGGVTLHLPRIVGLAKAKELIYTGKIINSKLAIELGLALDSFSEDDMLEKTISFAKEIAQKAPISLMLAKKRLQNSYKYDVETVLQIETDSILACMDTEDWQEGIDAFIEKRKPNYKGR